MRKFIFLTFYLNYSVGVQVLATILKRAGHDVSVIFFKLPSQKDIPWFTENPVNYEMVGVNGNIRGFNADVNPFTDKETALLIKRIQEESPDVLCVSCRSTDKELVSRLMPQIRENCNVLTVAGGYGPTLEPDYFSRFVDYVFVGEGDCGILDIANALEQGRSIEELPNVCFRKGDQLVQNPLAKPSGDEFCFQDVSEKICYIDHDRIYEAAERESIAPVHAYSIFFGRGCISSCSYCCSDAWRKLYRNQGLVVAKRRNRPMEDLQTEILTARDRGYTYIHFRDEFLCAPTHQLKEFFAWYEKEVCIPFWAFLVPDQVLEHPELLEMAVNSGLVDTELGFQSGSDQLNRTIFNRKISNGRVADYARLLASYDVNMKYDFILFNPAEQREHWHEAFQLIQQLPKKRAYLQLARLHYFPHSPIRESLTGYSYRPFEDYYCQALLYLICFVTSPDEFRKVLNDEALTQSWQSLKDFYQSYLKTQDIRFEQGTHDVPDSITTHRYRRIIANKKYNQVIVWKDDAYYRQMAHVFDGLDLVFQLQFNQFPTASKHPELKQLLDNKTPIFICGSDKYRIKKHLKTSYPGFSGEIFV